MTKSSRPSKAPKEAKAPTGAKPGGKANVNEVAVNEGRWEDDEHERFLEAMAAYKALGDKEGMKKWPCIAEAVGTRTTLQCRSHAQKHYIKEQKRPHYGSSKYCGVSRQGHQFTAMISEQGQNRNLGYFPSEVEAAKAYDARSRQLGRLTRLNFPTANDSAAAAVSSEPQNWETTPLEQAPRHALFAPQTVSAPTASDEDTDSYAEITPLEDARVEEELESEPEQDAATPSTRLSNTATSKYTGVHRYKDQDRFVAQITEKNKNVHLGSFSSEVEAAKAYDARSRQLGRLKRLNFPTADESAAAAAASSVPRSVPCKYTGVYRYRNHSLDQDRFCAQIREKNKHVHLGTFSSEVEAAKAFDARARQLGRLKHLNFPIVEDDAAAAAASAAPRLRETPSRRSPSEDINYNDETMVEGYQIMAAQGPAPVAVAEAPQLVSPADEDISIAEFSQPPNDDDDSDKVVVTPPSIYEGRARRKRPQVCYQEPHRGVKMRNDGGVRSVGSRPKPPAPPRKKQRTET